MKRRLVLGKQFLEKIGSSLLHTFESLYEFCVLVAKTFQAMFSRPFYFSLVTEQFYLLIYRSLPIVLITALSTGAVMALQFGYGMQRFGGKLFVPTIVTVSIVRVLGPVFTCLMLSGRVGAGIAAEIGSMTATQQVDAIRALGTDPIRKLVVPRIVVLIIGAPLLTLLADIFGVGGGLLVSASGLQISPSLYLQKAYAAIKMNDVLVGTGKTIIFGMLIGFIGCYNGLKTKEGTTGIGKATTKTVVLSSICVMIGDVIFTKLSWILKW